jgi:hypothetical protein
MNATFFFFFLQKSKYDIRRDKSRLYHYTHFLIAKIYKNVHIVQK